MVLFHLSLHASKTSFHIVPFPATKTKNPGKIITRAFLSTLATQPPAIDGTVVLRPSITASLPLSVG